MSKRTRSPRPTCRGLTLLALASVLCVGLSACERRVAPVRDWQASDHGQPVEADPARTPPPAEPEEGGPERAVEALYSVTCAGCHGRDGRGQGLQKPPGAQLPSFADAAWQSSRSDAQLREVIKNGRGLMPGFGKQLNDAALDAIVKRVRQFSP